MTGQTSWYRKPDMLPVNAEPSPFCRVPWRTRLMNLALMGSDFVAVFLAYLVAHYLYESPFFEGIRLRPSQDMFWAAGGAGSAAPLHTTAFLSLGLGMGALLVMTFGWLGLYSRGVSMLNIEEDVILVKGILVNGAVCVVLSFFIREYPVARLAILMALLLMPAFVALGRRTVRALGAWLLSTRLGAQSVIVYGAGETGQHLADRLQNNPQLGFLPIGFLDDEIESEDGWVYFGPGRRERAPFLGDENQLLNCAEATGARYLFVAKPAIGTARLMEIQERCRELRIACYFVPLFAMGAFRRLAMTMIGDIPLMYEKVASMQTAQRWSKRVFDLIASSLLLTLLALLFALIALAIKLSSRGPVFFTQDRIGRNGRFFRIVKFRTMHVHAEAYRHGKTSQAQQIFPVGRFLRRTSLDEFPQLVNVLKGEMSLVGPRPDMPHVVKTYNPIQRERLLVLPGMTGLWQVSGNRNTPIHENVDYDLYYIYNQSLLMDLIILTRTVIAMFQGR